MAQPFPPSFGGTDSGFIAPTLLGPGLECLPKQPWEDHINQLFPLCHPYLGPQFPAGDVGRIGFPRPHRVG